MKHENPTVNYVPRNPLWDIFMSRANASALHIIAPPIIVFSARHPANAFGLYTIAPPSHSIARKSVRPRPSTCGGFTLKTAPGQF